MSNIWGREFWILEKVDSWPEDRPDSTRWKATPGRWKGPAHDELVPDLAKEHLAEPALVVGSAPWSEEDDAATVYPFGPDGLASLSPTAGKVIIGTRYRGPAPAWANERGRFELGVEKFFDGEGRLITSCHVLAPGLWPSVSYQVTG